MSQIHLIHLIQHRHVFRQNDLMIFQHLRDLIHIDFRFVIPGFQHLNFIF